jgi:endonuclease III
MNKHDIEQFFARLKEQRPEPRTELAYTTAFELLIAVLLSAQSTDVGVNKATTKLYAVANTPAAILALGLDGLKTYIKTIGLYNSKAENIIKTCQILLDQHDGEVPDTREALEALAGVGRKTANVVLNTFFGQPTMAVDTHIFRVSNRTGLGKGKTVEIVEQKLIKAIPTHYIMDAHHWMILHGRYTCKARSPVCGQCIVSDLCSWKERFDYGVINPMVNNKEVP